MYIPSKSNSITGQPNWLQIMAGIIQKAGYELNCMRIGIVNAFYPEDLTVDVQIVNKKTLELNKDGTQNVMDFPVIRAKICYCSPNITYPINPGDECVLLFSDREIESWFINGDVNPEGYPRMHSLTDAVALFGIRSLPQMISIATDALQLFYGSSVLQISNNDISVNTQTLGIFGNTVQEGSITATSLNATSAATGTFQTADSKTVTVTNGIITAIA